MGKIKEATFGDHDEQEFEITEQDLAYIQLFQKAAIDSYNYHRNLVQRYLAIMAADRWHYPEDAELNFEIDPKTRMVKVTVAKPLDK